MSELVGRTLGHYRVEAFLGAGGMGDVYQAVHVHLNRPVAVKVMHSSLVSDAGSRARFLQEAQAAAALSHPYIVEVYDFGDQDGQSYLVMELLTDGSLRTLLDASDGDSSEHMPRLLALVLQAADGLAYAHSRGVVHRDIKPDNLLLKRDDSPTEGAPDLSLKISDFGLARLAEGSLKTTTGLVMGTPAYMSPEQCQGTPVDGRSDLYSLGIILYEVATGQLPFAAGTISEAVYKHVYTEPPPPRQIRPDLPPALEAVILRCLAKRPDDRYPNGQELASELRGAMTGGGETVIAGSPDTVIAAGTVLETPPPLPGPDQTAIAAPVTGTTVPPSMPSVAPSVAAPHLVVLDSSQRVIQTVDIPEDGLTIGRAPDNTIALDEESISRHHARLDRGEGAVTVTDLGSSNGTMLAGTRLLPHVAQEWTGRDWLRIGPYWLRIELPRRAVVSAAPPAQTAVVLEAGTGRLRVVLEKDRLTIIPGQQTAVQATLGNVGTLVDHLAVTVEGVPEGWVTLPEKEVQLNPGGTATVELPVLVDRSPENRAGDYAVTIRATSHENPEESGAAEAHWTVLPFTDFDVALAPKRVTGWRHGSYVVTATNAGNALVEARLAGADDEGKLGYGFLHDTVSIDAGTKASVPLTVGAPWRWLWTGLIDRGQERRFTVKANVGETPVEVPGTFVQRGLIPVWLPPLLLALIVGLTTVLAKSGGGHGTPTPTPRPTATPRLTATPRPVATKAPTATHQAPGPVPGPGGATATPASPQGPPGPVPQPKPTTPPPPHPAATATKPPAPTATPTATPPPRIADGSQISDYWGTWVNHDLGSQSMLYSVTIRQRDATTATVSANTRIPRCIPRPQALRECVGGTLLKPSPSGSPSLAQSGQFMIQATSSDGCVRLDLQYVKGQRQLNTTVELLCKGGPPEAGFLLDFAGPG